MGKDRESNAFGLVFFLPLSVIQRPRESFCVLQNPNPLDNVSSGRFDSPLLLGALTIVVFCCYSWFFVVGVFVVVFSVLFCG